MEVIRDRILNDFRLKVSLCRRLLLGFFLLFEDSAVETLIVCEFVLFLREFAIRTVVDEVEVCGFLFDLACWLGIFLSGRPRVFPVRLRSFAVAISGGHFVGWACSALLDRKSALHVPACSA